jgi:hypothetical protein
MKKVQTEHTHTQNKINDLNKAVGGMHQLQATNK